MINTKPPESFESRLTHLINEYSLENGSDTPDYILAGYLYNCLQAFNSAYKERYRWYNDTMINEAHTDKHSK